MKINQWTLGLATVGVISLASAVNAEEAKMNALETALSSTTISGYVDTSVAYTLGDQNSTIQSAIPFQSGKSDGFNLNVVKLSIEKPMDESEWASGYKVDLLFGPDAVNYNTSANADGGGGPANQWTSSDFGIKQAYVALRTPVGNGIDWKIGVFDTIIGYETFESGNNPNYTRSWGYAIEPTQHTGILGTYRINDTVSVAGGIAYTLSYGINDRAVNYTTGRVTADWRKTVLGSVAVTAPKDMGFLSGSTFYGGVIIGINNGAGVGGSFAGKNYAPAYPVGNSGSDQNNYYVGATLNTPVAGLKAGFAFDYVNNYAGNKNTTAWINGLYASYQATEKMSLHLRGEYGEISYRAAADAKDVITGVTLTAQYDLWKNVISRLEVRWDQAYTKDVTLPGGASNDNTGASIFANIIYKF